MLVVAAAVEVVSQDGVKREKYRDGTRSHQASERKQASDEEHARGMRGGFSIARKGYANEDTSRTDNLDG